MESLKMSKINKNTLSNKFEKGGLQKVDIRLNVDIRLQIDALQLYWIKRLFGDFDHQWKVLPKIFLEQIMENIMSSTHILNLARNHK